MKLIFLHIPKTAGQSIRAFLTDFCGEQKVCPALENFQLLQIPLRKLRTYEVFSGHLDWALLDAVEGKRFIFTVLRRPSERILSFYFFLRRKAAQTPPEVLALQDNQGLRAALTLAPDEYFCAGRPALRKFIDGSYDNFYTYYFAGRTFDARRKLLHVMTRQNVKFSKKDILHMALDNLETLDRVYTVHGLQALQDDVAALVGKAGHKSRDLASFRLNEGTGDYESRLAELRSLGASARTFDRLEEMTELDNEIWQRFSQRLVARPIRDRLAKLAYS